jgi:PAS domain S-box-containing protein
MRVSGGPLDVPALRRQRTIAAIAGVVYLLWWFTVEVTLPGSFNPLPGRLLVVAGSGALVAASYRSAWVRRRFSVLFTAWVCLLAAHYGYLIVGNHGESTWWVGAFVTVAATGMCLQSPREVLAFSLFALAGVLGIAAALGQLAHSIYIPGLATILLLANVTKRSQLIAQDARLQLAAIVESSSDAIIGTDLEGVIRSWNRGAERLFGHAAPDVIGGPLSVLLLPGLQAEDAALFARLRAGEQIAPIETVRRHRDGGALDVSITISPIRDSRGGLVGASIAARDISDRKRADAEVRRAREEAEAANRELEAFNYSVAHDLRSPLRAVDGFASRLLDDYGEKVDEVGQTHLRRVREAAKHMGLLIDGLLALSRLGRVGLRDQRVDLSEIARATAQRLRESQPERDVEIVIQSGLAARGDAALLGDALENLLGNAWKFTRDTHAARIELGAVEDAGRTEYFVRDNGAGFDMAYASKLFGVFQRLHARGEFEGTGVGLATVRRIVQRHGGDIRAEGKLGEGACFRFTLGDRPA